MEHKSSSTPATYYAKPDRDLSLDGLRDDVTPSDRHFLLRHSDLPAHFNVQSWRLKVGGLVKRPLSLSLADIKSRSAVTTAVTMECVGNGRQTKDKPRRMGMVGNARWTGARLNGILREAGLDPKAVEIVFTGFDLRIREGKNQPYYSSLASAEAMRDDMLLAYGMNGEPLPEDHGFPLRLIVPGWFGMYSVRWLASIEAVGQPADDKGKYGGWFVPDTYQPARAMMIPPGTLDEAGGAYRVKAGRLSLTGRAWGGRFGLKSVELSADAGATWQAVRLEHRDDSPFGWRTWTFGWLASPGAHTLFIRATDMQGTVQPTTAEGSGKTAAQRVDVVIE
jgi:DMSO/TMAO reductase YedYZ molybdopterin-dependent catalytic subunit